MGLSSPFYRVYNTLALLGQTLLPHLAPGCYGYMRQFADGLSEDSSFPGDPSPPSHSTWGNIPSTWWVLAGATDACFSQLIVASELGNVIFSVCLALIEGVGEQTQRQIMFLWLWGLTRVLLLFKVEAIRGTLLICGKALFGSKRQDDTELPGGQCVTAART